MQGFVHHGFRLRSPEAGTRLRRHGEPATPRHMSAEDEKAARLAAALRANLAKRKAQKRARADLPHLDTLYAASQPSDGMGTGDHDAPEDSATAAPPGAGVGDIVPGHKPG